MIPQHYQQSCVSVALHDVQRSLPGNGHEPSLLYVSDQISRNGSYVPAQVFLLIASAPAGIALAAWYCVQKGELALSC